MILKDLRRERARFAETRFQTFAFAVLLVVPVVALWPVADLEDPLVIVAVVVLGVVYVLMTYFVWGSVLPTSREGAGAKLLGSIVSGLILFVGAWTNVHWHSAGSVADCFSETLSRWDALYFTLTTLTTTGFGDIQPVATPCRLLVSLQMATGAVIVFWVLVIAAGNYSDTFRRSGGS